jgi:hypothetical protein
MSNMQGSVGRQLNGVRDNGVCQQDDDDASNRKLSTEEREVHRRSSARRAPETSSPAALHERNRELKEMISEAQEDITIKLDTYEIFVSNLMRSEAHLERVAHRADKVHAMLLEAAEAPHPSEEEEEEESRRGEGRSQGGGGVDLETLRAEHLNRIGPLRGHVHDELRLVREQIRGIREQVLAFAQEKMESISDMIDEVKSNCSLTIAAWESSCPNRRSDLEGLRSGMLPRLDPIRETMRRDLQANTRAIHSGLERMIAQFRAELESSHSGMQDEDTLSTIRMDMEIWLIHVDMVSHHCPRDNWYGLFLDDRLYFAPPVIT